MLQLPINQPGRLQHLLCIGAHCDDIEIGCGGTVLALLADNPGLHVDWVVMSSDDVREREARASAADFLGKGGNHRIVIQRFRNGYFPSVADGIKDFFEGLKKSARPDLILSHHRGDFHQDHRVVADLTWNTFRDHLILGYEIPKYDGDLGRPNIFVPLSDPVRAHKLRAILTHFASQQDKQWWSESTFNALMRLRGIESNAASGFAEAFFGPKVTLSTSP